MLPPAARETVARVLEDFADDGTCLLAVTGSLANGTWREGWSDIDVLLVRRALGSEWLVGASAHPVAPAHISAFTAAEVRDGALPARVLNALRLIALDDRGVLYRAASWSAPRFDLAAGAAASAGDLPQTLLLLRRHLMDAAFDLRTMYKLVILAARIRLRISGLEPDTSDQVIRAFAENEGLDPAWLPSLEEVVEAKPALDADRQPTSAHSTAAHAIGLAVAEGAATVLRIVDRQQDRSISAR